MRLISTWMVAFFLAAIFAATASLRRFHRPVTALLALTPAVFFLTGSINPNALEIASTGDGFASLCAIAEQTASKVRPSTLLLVVFTLSASVLAHTRPLSVLWLAIAATAAVLCFGIKSFSAHAGTKEILGSAAHRRRIVRFCTVVGPVGKSFQSLMAGARTWAAVEISDSGTP